MALSKLNFNSLNLTPVAGKGIGFDSGADDLEASFSGGSMTFIKKLTADGSGTNLSFVHGSSDVVLDSTYKEYLFLFKDIHPATDSVNFYVNFSIDGGSNYNVTKTTTWFYAYHNESGSTSSLEYNTALDLAQSTANQPLMENIGNDNDQSGSGFLTLYNPSSTTFVKHFTAQTADIIHADYTENAFIAGYANTTSAVNGVRFVLESGNIDAGTITLYGIN